MPEPLFTRRFVALWVFAFITFFSAFQLLPAIPFRIIELGGTKAQAGWFLTAYTFASAFAAPIMGTIADHIGRKRMLMIASALFIAFSLLYGAVGQIPLLLLIGIVHGALWSGLMSAASAIMSEFIPESRRTEGLAYWGLAGNMAIAAAPAVGLMVFHYGWFALCVEMALLSTVMLVWSSRLPGIEHRVDTVLPTWSEAWDWRVIRAALSMAVIAFGYGGVTSYVAIMSGDRHIEPKWLFFAVYAITVVLVRVFTARLGDVFGVGYLLYPSFAAFPVSLFLLATANSRPDLLVSAILFGIGFGGAWPAFANFIITNTDARWRARSFGSIVLAFDSGIGIGSLVTGSIIGRHSYATAFTVAGAVSCLAIPIFIMASRGMRQRETT